MTKKTRELPNVTECHCCHLRVDLAKSNNLLHLLYSEWRVVLLCPKCLSRVESTELCSFCFTSSADNECFSCRNCRRRVHRDCDSQHRTSSVWSGSSSAAADELSVCGDCFVSESLARWRRSRNSSGYGRKNRIDFEGGKPSVSEDQRKCDSDLSPPVCDTIDEEEEKEDNVDEEEVLNEGQGSCSNEVIESESLPACCLSKGENRNATLDPYYFKYRRRRTSSVDNSLLTYKRISVAEAVERCKGLRRRNVECPLFTYKRRGSFVVRFMFTYKRRKNFDEAMLTYRRRRLDKAES